MKPSDWNSDNSASLSSIFENTLKENLSSIEYNLKGYRLTTVQKEKIIDGEKHTVNVEEYVKVTEPLMNNSGISFVMSFLDDIFSSKNMHLSHFENEDSAKAFLRQILINMVTTLAGSAGRFQIRDFNYTCDILIDNIYISVMRIVGGSSDKNFLAKVTSENVVSSVNQQTTENVVPQQQHRKLFGIIPMP